MNVKQQEEILNIVQTFLKENQGNRINQWLATPLYQTLKEKLDKIVATDNAKNETPASSVLKAMPK